MTAMPSIPGGLTWDPQDRLQKTDHQGGGITYYVYDSSGIRARKVHVNQAGTTSKERLYLGPWETYRETTDLLGTPTLDLERETLHVQTEAGDACLLETKTVENAATIQNPTTHHRYQHHNHLGTASVELTAAAEVISYEEYHPYGTSAYRAANSAVDVSAKRYRYTGKERDEESGLYYHEARYYACWLARWIAADPIGLRGGTNRFLYANSNPLTFADLDGTSPTQRAREDESPHPSLHLEDLKTADGRARSGSELAAKHPTEEFLEGSLLVLEGPSPSDTSLMVRMGELLIDYAVADQAHYKEQKASSSKALEDTKEERRTGKASRRDVADARRHRRTTRRERHFRGHSVEWETVAFSVTTEQGRFVVLTAPVPGPRTSLGGAKVDTPWTKADIADSFGVSIAQVERLGSVHTHPENLLGRRSAEVASGRGSDRGDVHAVLGSQFDAIVTPSARLMRYSQNGKVLPQDSEVGTVSYEDKRASGSTKSTIDRIKRLRGSAAFYPFQERRPKSSP